MDADFDFWTVQAMMKFGGSFIRGLAAATMHADRKNLAKIKETWSEYWKEYEEKGQVMRFEACKFGECDGSGEISVDEQDGEGHTMRGVGTESCRCGKRKQ